MVRSLFASFIIVFVSVDISAGQLLVSDYLGHAISMFDIETGRSLGLFAGLEQGIRGAEGMTIGPDGDIYVVMGESSPNPQTVRRFTRTGNPMGVFSTLGDNTFASRLTFGPDRNLLVTFAAGAPVRKYDGATGAFLSNFAIGGGLQIGAGITFGADGHLYVSSYTTGSVKRYNGTSGAYMGDFAFGNGLDRPSGLTFGPDGNLYVASAASDQIKRYSGTTGKFLDNFAQGGGLSFPNDIAFGPDANLYVTSFGTNQLKRYDGLTGAFIDTFVPIAGTAGYATCLLFIPIPEPPSAVLLILAATFRVRSRRTNSDGVDLLPNCRSR